MLNQDTITNSVRHHRTANNEAIKICRDLRIKFHELAAEYGIYGNIYSLFFHDLIIHFTGIIIQRDTVKDYKDVYDHRYGNELPFPFVSKQYANCPYPIDEYSYKLGLTRNQTVSSIRRLPILSVTVGDAIPVRRQTYSLSRKLFSLFTTYCDAEAAFLPNLPNQLQSIKETITDWCKRYEISNVTIILDNWDRYVRFNVSEQQSTIKNRGLIVGTRSMPQNRKRAINYLQQGKPVLGFTHGEITNTVFNEPIFGYSELALCSALVDYGEMRHHDYDLNKPLTTPAHINGRTSIEIKKIFRPNDAIINRNINKIKVLYIPTSYSGNFCYGPYRAYEDEVYKHWQECLISMLDNVTIKVHPKSANPSFCVELESRWLEDCVEDYDLLILDYYSTGASVSIFTEKPVIFFDLGLRNLNEEFMELLRARCNYTKIDMTGDMIEQIKIALNKYNESTSSYSNEALKEYSIRSDGTEGFWSAIYQTFYS